MNFLKALLFVTILFFTTSALAAYDPALNWQQLESPHFVVYFPEELGPLAQKSALHLEETYWKWGHYMAHYPREKVILLITDHTDSANGSAQVTPRPIIKYYVTPFADLSELMDMEDRTSALLTHEYMHILHLDKIGGLPKLFNTIFGQWWSPNALQPTFLLEGYTVYAESIDGHFGRLNSPLMTGYLRALAMGDRLPTLDQLANARSRWPYGNAPYLLGGHLMRRLDQLSPGWPERYAALYGRRLVPYFIMSRGKMAGLSLPAVYRQLLLDLQKEAQDKQQTVEQLPFPKPRLLTANGHSKSPLIWSQGQLYFISGNASADSQLYSYQPATDTITPLTRAQSNSHLAVNPQNGDLYFTVIEAQNRFTTYNELQKLAPGKHLSKRVKAAPKRLSQPAFSHDGRQVVYVINQGGHSQLWLANSDFSKPQLLQQAPDDRVYYYPQFSPDDKTIITATWYHGGQRLFDIFSNKSGHFEYSSSFTPGGRHVSGQHYSSDGQTFYFHGDLDNETFDIFAMTPTAENDNCQLYRLTASVAGAFYPLDTDSELYYLELTANGYELAQRPLAPEGWQPLKTVACPGLFAPTAADSRQNFTSLPAATASQPFVTAKYSPWSTLLPRLWLPYFSQDAYGNTLGLSTSGSDILGHHSYSLSLEWGLSSYYPGLAFSYTNNMLPFSITAAVSHYMGVGRATQKEPWRNHYGHQVTNASLGLSYNLSRWNHYWSFSANYLFRYYRFYTRRHLTSKIPDDHYGALALNVGFSNVRSFNQSLHNAKGFTISLGLQMEHPALGSTNQSYLATYNYQQYQQIPKLRTTLAWRLQGGFGYSPSAISSLFSLGGPAHTNLDTVISSLSASTSNYLRGFSTLALEGNSYIKGTLEWRLLLWRIERGLATLPIYFDQLHLALFCDVAYATPSLKEFSTGTLAIGPGVELRLDVKLGYYEAGTISLGYAHGIGPQAIHNFYLLYGYLF